MKSKEIFAGLESNRQKKITQPVGPTRKPCYGRETAPCRCKNRYLSKFTAASRGSPCDSTASFKFNFIHGAFKKLIFFRLTWQ